MFKLGLTKTKVYLNLGVKRFVVWDFKFRVYFQDLMYLLIYFLMV